MLLTHIRTNSLGPTRQRDGKIGNHACRIDVYYNFLQLINRVPCNHP